MKHLPRPGSAPSAAELADVDPRCILLLGAAPGAARAGEPTMPLSEVQPGMRCVASSVVQGVAISTFDVTVTDVIAGDAAARSPYILFRASGPAIDGTGIGPGFSVAPVR